MKTEHIVFIVVVVVILFLVWNNKCNENFDSILPTTSGTPVTCDGVTGVSWDMEVADENSILISSETKYLINKTNDCTTDKSVAQSLYDCDPNKSSAIVFCEEEADDYICGNIHLVETSFPVLMANQIKDQGFAGAVIAN